jgi:hypothetical protein
VVLRDGDIPKQGDLWGIINTNLYNAIDAKKAAISGTVIPIIYTNSFVETFSTASGDLGTGVCLGTGSAKGTWQSSTLCYSAQAGSWLQTGSLIIKTPTISGVFFVMDSVVTTGSSPISGDISINNGGTWVATKQFPGSMIDTTGATGSVLVMKFWYTAHGSISDLAVSVW